MVFSDEDPDAEVVGAVAPQVVGPEDAAVLAADGTTIGWGKTHQLERKGYDDALALTIKGLPGLIRPPSSRLEQTKEQLLQALRQAGRWDCDFDEADQSPEPSSLGRIGIRATLDCSQAEIAPGQRVAVTFADDGPGIDDLRFSARHRTDPGASGTTLLTGLRAVWPLLRGPAGWPAAVERQVRSGVGGIVYSGGWKIVVDVRADLLGSSYSGREFAGYVTSVRILSESAQYMDPREP
ncbi:hypothetical protein [Kribbella amoyensis]|uniref:hypothetical protein n=1 Tax=Kribbella amoyensis TaxID=996641 RepID=UPI0011A8DCAA|nr:hypothetical protein [Kribbella amoyensis]